MGSKWTMRSAQRTLIGTLDRVYVPSRTWWRPKTWAPDHDSNLVITPDAAHQGLLANRFGARNAEGDMECEVQVTTIFRASFNNWVETLLHTTVTAVGVHVDDDGHEHRTELHPIDLVAGRVTASSMGDRDWIKQRAGDRGLRVGADMFAWRFAAAADTRDGLLFEGAPLSMLTRPIRCYLPLPSPPGPTWTPVVDHRIMLNSHASVAVRVAADPSAGAGAERQLELLARCNSYRDDGPGVLLGEAIAYWTNPAVPELTLEPTRLVFGTVPPNEMPESRRIRIRNTGVAPLVITLAEPVPGSVFTWTAMNRVTVGAGQFLDATVRFRPRRPGPATGVWAIATNNALGPTRVDLEGEGRAGIPP